MEWICVNVPSNLLSAKHRLFAITIVKQSFFVNVNHSAMDLDDEDLTDIPAVPRMSLLIVRCFKLN